MVFPALLPLTYIPALLQRVKQLFLSLFEPYLQSFVEALADRTAPLAEGGRSALRILGQKIADEHWDRIFDRCLKNQEESAGKRGGRSIPIRTQSHLTATGAESESSPGVAEALPHRADNAAPQSGDDSHPVTAEDIAKNVQALKGRMKGRKGRGRDG